MAARAPPVPAPGPTPGPAPVHAVSRHGRERLQPRLRVTHPNDPAEREADRIAQAIGREVGTPSPRLQAASPLQRKAAASGAPPPASAARLRAAAQGGTALTPAQRAMFEPRLRADLSAVRLHTGPEAGRLAVSLGARALTHGRHIFFAPGEYRPETPEGIELLAHELVHTVQQGAAPAARVQRKPAEPVRERLSADSLAGWGLADLLSGLSDLAHAIPGYRMLTIVLGADPITGRGVARSAANILRALVEFLPGGVVITRVLDAHGVFDRIAALASAALGSVGLSSAGLRALLDQFLDTVSWRDVFDPAGIWRRASRIFAGPVDRLIAAGRALLGQILSIVREAVLKPLAALAEGTEGYALLKAVLGFDPVTGEAVPRTAETLIAPFLRMIGQDELWQNLQRANAIPRAFAWFSGAMAGVVALVRSIPGRFLAALGELQITDFLVLPRAFLRLAGAFAGFLGAFASFAGSTVLDLLKIIVEVVAPGVMPYIQRAGAAFQTILRNPVGFVSNLVRAGRMGFEQFAGRFLAHLRAALVGWLTGTLGGTGVHIPQAFTLPEILRFVLSVLGLTWAQVRTRLVRILGEAPVRALETGFALVRTLVTQGPAATWQEIVAAAGNLRDMVIEQVMAFVKSRVVEAAVTRLVSMLSPAGALIQAIIAIYNTVMFFVERLRQIAQVAAAFIDSIAAIAAGSLGAAANRVEQTMAGLLTLVISFLARIAGLGRVADAVTGLIRRVRAPIERGIDRVVQWIVAQARRAGRFIAQAGVPQDPATRLRLASRDSIALARALRGRVTAPLLERAFSLLRTRYGLASLTVRQTPAGWMATARINPELSWRVPLPGETAGTGGISRVATATGPGGVATAGVIGEVRPGIRRRGMERALPGAGDLTGDAGNYLAGYRRAHLYGPGFGDETAIGLMYASVEVNNELQSRGAKYGIEGYTRQILQRVRQLGGRLAVEAIATSYPDPPPGVPRPLGQPVLHRVVYTFVVLDAAGNEIRLPSGRRATATITCGPPLPGGAGGRGTPATGGLMELDAYIGSRSTRTGL